MKKKNRLLRFAFVLAFLVSLGLGNELWAATYYSIGTGNWADGTKWSLSSGGGQAGAYPGSGDIAYIEDADVITLTANVTTGSVYVRNVAGVTASTIHLNGYTLNIDGNLTVTGGAAATNDATITGTVDGSKLIVTGNMSINGITTAGIATVDMSAASTRTYLTVTGNIAVTNTGATDVEAILDLTNCDVSVAGTITAVAADVTVTTTATTNLLLSGTSQVTIPDEFTPLNALTINKTGVGSATQSLALTTDSLIITSGTFLKNGVAITVNEFVSLANDANANWNISGAGAVTIKSVAVFGDAGIVTSTSTTPMILGTGTETADISLPNDISNLASLVINRAAASTVTLNGDLTDAGVLTLTSGKLVVGLNTLSVGGAYTVGGANATLDLTGSSVVFSGATRPVFGAAIYTTNSSTNLTINTTEAATHTVLPTSISTLNNLTIATGAITILVDVPASLTLAGACTVTSGTLDLDVNNSTFVVNGALTVAAAAAAGLDLDGSTVTLNGPISLGAGSVISSATGTATNLTIGGTGSITIAATLSAFLNNFVMNRPGATFTLPATHTVEGSLTITNGTVAVGTTSQTITGATVVSAGGILNASGTTSVTFTDDISGAGTLNAATGILAFGASCSYNFTGNFITNNATRLTFTNDGVILQSSVRDLHTLVVNLAAASNEFTLNGDLTIATAFTPTRGTMIVGANTLTSTPAFAGAASFTLNANNSTLVFSSTSNFTNGTYITNNATNLSFAADVTAFPISMNNINNLSVSGAGAGALTLTNDITINGNFEVTGLLTDIDAAGFDVTVYGTLSLASTSNFDASASMNLYLYGGFEAASTVTWATPQNISLFVLGTGAQLNLPAGITDIGSIVLNRASGMKINATISATNGLNTAGCITLTSGDLDLNGFNITLGDVAASISENVTGGATIINTGSDGAYITTATGSTRAQNMASGIGLLNSAGDDDAFEVRRYPKVRTIAGVNLSVARYYSIENYAGSLTSLKLKYDNTELGNNSAGSLKIYYTKTASVNEFLGLSTIDSTTTTANTPGSAFGTVEGTAFSVAPATNGLFFAIASQSGSTGVVRIFNNAGGDGQWTTASNWNPAGVPTIDDDVTIGAYPVTISGNGITYYCKSLVLASPSSSLQPYTTVSAGDTVNLVVMGNIQISNAGGNIDGANGYGRLNIQIGDGVTPVTSTISPAQDYSPLAGGNGFSAYNLIVNSAAVTHSSNHKLRINKNVNIEGTSVFSQSTSGGTLVMYGGSGVQTIAVASIASLDLQNLELENSANVTTASNFILRENIKLDGPNDVFTATNGTINFQNAAGVSGWSVFPGATMKLWNAEFTGAANYTPSGDAQIQGDFTFSNSAGTFVPVNGTVLFSGSNLKNLVNTAAAASLQFYHLAVAPGASVATSSNFQINGDIDVQTNASFVADNGTIEFPATAPIPSNIKNASDHTLIFNNLTITDAVNTSDSWKISGNLNGAGTLTADNGTITFKNDVEKSISAGTFNFFKLSVADQSAVTTAINLSIRNNSTNPTGAGLEVLGSGSFKATANTVTFTTASDPGANYPKTISKSSAGTLQFFNLAIGTAVNNEVTTASNFEIIGGASAFVNNNAGLGGLFTATAGTVTFSGVGATITSTLPEATSFNSILVSNVTLTLPTLNYINITGDLTVNGASGIFTNATGATGLIKFNGTTQQKINGTSTQAVPVTISRLEINKTSGSTSDKTVLLESDLTLIDNANSDLILNSGYLNLGSKKLTNGDGTITYTHLGAINGASGTFYNVKAQANNVLFRDELFTVDNTSTLYNLTAAAGVTLDGNLTVNGTLSLTGAASDLALGSFTLTQLGNLTRTTGTFAAATGKLVLAGNGSTTGLSNSFFAAGAACDLNLEVARTEALTGNFTMAAGKDLTINTGIGQFDLSIYKLTSTTTSKVTRVSGAINAGTNSTVEFGTTGMDYIPANLFVNNTCYNIIFNGNTDRTLGGDLRVEGTMNMTTMADIITGDNVLTFGPSAVLPAFTSAAHVIGNLRRTVTSSATRFDVGDGAATDYRPLELNFSTSGNTQEITVSAKRQEPTVGKAGNPKNAVDVLYTFTPVGTDANDSLKVKFQWTPTLEGNGQLASITNASFPAKWENNSWVDYRNRLLTFTSANPRVLTMSGFPVANPAALKGEWAIFNATANTNVAKDNAISKTANKVVITKINPNPVALNKPFKVTVQLQDQYGQPITVTSPFYVTVSQEIGTATLSANITGVITAGNSYVELTGLYTGAGSKIQLKADTTNSSDNWQPQVSSLFNVLSADPTSQASAITLTNIANTSATIDWTNGSSTTTLIVIKADTLLIEGQEYPVSGTSYTANSLFGAGSPLGNAVVLYNSTNLVNGLDVKGLSPNTTYYVYAFTFTGSIGTENYKLSPASGNPKILNTTGSTDDDVAFGTNNTRATSKTIGTNTPVTGTIGTSTDEDWFNFSVTSTAPNVKSQLYGLGNNYNLEVYDAAGRRIRRGIRTATGSEGPVVNGLPAGTYTVRIYSADGSYSSTNTYTLKVGTKSSEIFSVTP